MFHAQARAGEGGGELGILLRVRGNDEDLGISAHGDEAGGFIILGDGVANSVDLDAVAVKARIGKSLRKCK